MIKITIKNRIFFIGKIEEIIEIIDDIITTYGKDAKLLDIIENCLKT
mgnify:CR=1 FL=1